MEDSVGGFGESNLEQDDVYSHIAVIEVHWIM